MPRLKAVPAGGPPRDTRQRHKPGHPAVLPGKAELCGVRTRAGSTAGPAGTPCRRAAGWGTPNRSGPCRFHGGTLPSIQAGAAATDRIKYAAHEAERAGLWGHRVEGARPLQQFAEELSRTAGRVAALEAHLVQLERYGAHQQRIDAVAAELAQERGHLLRTADAAGKAGLDDRDRKLAEADAQFVLDVLLAVLRDLRLDPARIEDAQALLGWYFGNYAPGAPVDGDPATPEPKPVTGLPIPASWVPRRESIEAEPGPEPTPAPAVAAGRELPDGSTEVATRRAGGDPLHHPADPRHRAGREGD